MPQDDNPRRVSLVFPIILISIGALFLFRSWRPAFDPWPILQTYWPLILIFIGVGKIWDSTYRRRNPSAPPGISIGATVGALAFVIRAARQLRYPNGFTGEHAKTVQLSNIGHRKRTRLRRKTELEARPFRFEDTHHEPVVAHAETHNRTGHRNRLSAGMH